MEWTSITELGESYGVAVGAGLLVGGFIALVNMWRA